MRADLCDALAAIGSKDGIPALVGVLRGELDSDARLHEDKIVRFGDRPELRADAKRTFRYLVNQDAGCMVVGLAALPA